MIFVIVGWILLVFLFYLAVRKREKLGKIICFAVLLAPVALIVFVSFENVIRAYILRAPKDYMITALPANLAIVLLTILMGTYFILRKVRK